MCRATENSNRNTLERAFSGEILRKTAATLRFTDRSTDLTMWHFIAIYAGESFRVCDVRITLIIEISHSFPVEIAENRKFTAFNCEILTPVFPRLRTVIKLQC